MSDSGSDFEFGNIGGATKTKKKKVVAIGEPTKTKTAAAVERGGKRKTKPLQEVDLDNDDSTDTMEVAKTSKARGKKVAGKAVEDIYQKKTQLEHILLRPDTYIGAVEAQQQSLWVLESPDQFIYKSVNIVPGLYKIVDEILVNAADNKVRDPGMDTIKVNIDASTNTIVIYNNGSGIPIQVHKDENVYVPELIFGHLLTSSNYDDDEKKITGGRNGYGAKLCNIFSHEFIVETADSVKKYRQVFSNNMSVKADPVILPNPKKEEYTRITFRPDLSKFGMSCIDADLEALLKKRVYDLAGILPGVKVFLNDERIPIKNFKQYVDMYVAKEPKPEILFANKQERWEVAFTLSEGQFQQVSFVNSICTSKGGTHVNYVADQLVGKIMEAVKKKNKTFPLKPFQVKNHMWLFINCQVENPAFDSQTKENMTLRASSFGSKCEFSEDFVKKVLKSGVVENILNFAKFKQEQQLKKTDGQKRSRITGIVKLEDANNAGTSRGRNCTLILTEGDSAKSLAVSGLSVIGRDNYGVYPLRGKLLNVREASHSQILNNAEITHMKQILGIQHGKDYQSVDGLRYGHLMIMTDQDHDGSHIKGLIINFFDHFFPSLLRIPQFLVEFITPIVRVTKGGQSINFFTIPEYENWREANQNGKGWVIKYYKGLGTSTSEDAKKYFSDMKRHCKRFSVITDEERGLVDLAFNKKKADDRKEWLRQFEPGTFIDHNVDEITYGDFINKELILFSMADNVRSIPSVMDGLKPGQRKVIYSCFKRKLKGEIKVAQLGGYISEHTAYHHGEQSLYSTIVGLAQGFVGSNNINLLDPRGQFGTRSQGGKDAASARYIFTALPPITRLLFPENDDPLLSYLNEDGQKIEPEWYIPVIPLVLVNGSEGIGTGWSSFIPNYNPLDIVRNLRLLMQDEPIQEMLPWYRGFTGVIEKIAPEKYKVSGKVQQINENTIEITELPIRSWTQNYKEQLELWLNSTEKSEALIKDYKEYHTDTTVHFVITLSPEQMSKALDEGLDKRFKINSTLATSNMVCFDRQGRIKKYNSPEQILEEFYHHRLEYYQKRKEMLLEQYTQEWSKASNRVRFILEIIQGKLVVQNRRKADIVTELKAKGYDTFKKLAAAAGKEESTEIGVVVEEEDNDDAHGYDYLLSMPIYNLTREKVEQLEKEKLDKETQLQWLTQQSPKDLWNIDLEAFCVQWEAMLAGDNSSATKSTRKPPTTSTTKRSNTTAAAKSAAAAAASKKKPIDFFKSIVSPPKLTTVSEPSVPPTDKKTKAPKQKRTLMDTFSRIVTNTDVVSIDPSPVKTVPAIEISTKKPATTATTTRKPRAPSKKTPATKSRKRVVQSDDDDDEVIDDDGDDDGSEDFVGEGGGDEEVAVLQRPKRQRVARTNIVDLATDDEEEEEEKSDEDYMEED